MKCYETKRKEIRLSGKPFGRRRGSSLERARRRPGVCRAQRSELPNSLGSLDACIGMQNLRIETSDLAASVGSDATPLFWLHSHEEFLRLTVGLCTMSSLVFSLSSLLFPTNTLDPLWIPRTRSHTLGSTFSASAKGFHQMFSNAICSYTYFSLKPDSFNRFPGCRN